LVIQVCLFHDPHKHIVMVVRLAGPNDAIDVLNWRNDPQTRIMSWNVGLINKATHIKWFNASIENRNRILLIGELGEMKIGMIRFDLLPKNVNVWKVSIMVAPESRCQGIGTNFLTHAIAYFHPKFPDASVLAEVKASNTASHSIFERLGFSKIECSEEKTIYSLEF